MDRICKYCGKTFSVGREFDLTSPVFCCREHMNEYHKVHMAAAERAKICGQCGEPFISNHPLQVYCSKKCRVNHNGSRKRRPTNKDREYRCKACGKPIQPIRHNSRKSYCDEKCRAAYFNNLKFDHAKCYLKEAKAMLAGKHWEGKNRCQRLEGDD